MSCVNKTVDGQPMPGWDERKKADEPKDDKSQS